MIHGEMYVVTRGPLTWHPETRCVCSISSQFGRLEYPWPSRRTCGSPWWLGVHGVWNQLHESACADWRCSRGWRPRWWQICVSFLAFPWPSCIGKESSKLLNSVCNNTPGKWISTQEQENCTLARRLTAQNGDKSVLDVKKQLLMGNINI